MRQLGRVPGSTEFDWGSVDDTPALGGDFDGLPFLVSQIPINAVFQPGNPQIFSGVEKGSRNSGTMAP
jgi:hypothetical protein